MTYDISPEVYAYAAQKNLETTLIAMKNTHHATLDELLIGHDLRWAT